MAAARVRRTGQAPKKGSTGGNSVKSHIASPVTAETADELKRVQAVLDDYKAQDLVVIPLAGQASFADYLVIATGTSTRHVSSMGQALQDKLGKKAFVGVEGLGDGEWVCADMGNIVIHLFTPEKRTLYNLEKLWSYAFTEPTDDPTS